MVMALSLFSCTDKTCEGDDCACILDAQCEIVGCYAPDPTDCTPDCDCSDGQPMSTQGAETWWAARAEHCGDSCIICATEDCHDWTSLRPACRRGRCVAVRTR